MSLLILSVLYAEVAVYRCYTMLSKFTEAARSVTQSNGLPVDAAECSVASGGSKGLSN